MSVRDKPSGYKMPPAEHRFQRGQSGNPQGRPRKPKPASIMPSGSRTGLEAMAYRIANRPVSFRDGDKTGTVPMIEAALLAEAAQAAKGKRLDRKDMLERHERIDAKMQAEKREDYDDWSMIKAFKLEQRKTIPEDRWKYQVVHPDDIILGPDYAVDIIGPINAAELASVETSCRYRDLMILQSVFDCHCRVKSKDPLDCKDLLPLSLVMAIWIDCHVFRRFRLGDGELDRAVDQHLYKMHSELEYEIKTERQALGVNVVGRVRPMPHFTIAQATKFLRTASGLRNRR